MEKKIEDANNKKNLITAIKIVGVVLESSELTELFKETFDEYDSNWALDNGTDNKPKEDLIKSEIFAKAQVELRAMVDETIKEELIILKMAYARDLSKVFFKISYTFWFVIFTIKYKLITGKKYKAPKKTTKKIARNRRSRNSKSTADPYVILEELVKNNLIKKTVTSRFVDFQGEVSLSAWVVREEPYYSDPPYSLGDICQVGSHNYLTYFV